MEFVKEHCSLFCQGLVWKQNPYQICEIGDPGQALVDDEFEGHRGKDEGEGQLQAVLGQAMVNGERREGQERDQGLEKQGNGSHMNVGNTSKPLLPTGSEVRGVFGVGSIPVAIRCSYQDMKTIAL